MGKLSDNRFKKFVELMPQCAAVIQSGGFVLCNGKMKVSTGFSDGDLRSMSFADIAHQDDRQAFQDMIQKVMESKAEETSGALRIINKSGELRWLEISSKRIIWQRKPAALILAVDATARKGSEQTLTTNYARLEATFRALPDLMLEVDHEGRIFEPTAPHPMHPSARSIKDFLPAEAVAVSIEGIKKAARTGRHSGTAFQVLCDGEERWLEQSVSAIGDHHRPDVHFIVLLRDITERRRQEKQAAETGKMEAVGRLAGGISHDFNNILQTILGSCNLIRERIDDEREVLRCSEVIDDSVERAAALTHQLLAFSRKQIIQPVVRDLNDFLRNSEPLLRRAVEADIELVVATEREPLWVNVDPAQLQQVLLILAANAQESIPGKGKLSFEVRRVEAGPQMVGAPAGIPTGTYALLTAWDSGIGMDRLTLSHIFEPFFTTKDVGKGCGLGLSIGYGIVSQMGGFISVDSVAGSGTTFRIYLPLIGQVAGHDCAADGHEVDNSPGGE